MGNWNKLMYTRTARHEAWLIWIKRFFCQQALKNCIKNDFFKKFATNKLEGNRLIIIHHLFVSFFVNKDSIGLFPSCLEVTGFQAIMYIYLKNIAQIVFSLLGLHNKLNFPFRISVVYLNKSETARFVTVTKEIFTAQKMKSLIKYFFGKCDHFFSKSED